MDSLASWQADQRRVRPLVDGGHEAEGNQRDDDMIIRIYDIGRDLFQAFVRALKNVDDLPKPLYRRFECGYTRYVGWALDYNVQDDTLDRLLAESRRLRELTVEILIDICALLRQGQTPLH
ncbi:hypothetical protein GGS23DRAFT_596159 [Durotheca rogersii]|uniref:uncharacterized protein n=1 Tax=Durotheca rogersii TaxID=419775 RepID=UPI00221F33C8|nr:uncharacterized protein GGS23DRAFT_596159 [Durotheca rogersii]KAI5863655.1 hypothetical protein GGS23DRAFT_596159 [Durotheca rogersii]